MKENEFWGIIDRSNDQDDFEKEILEYLCTLSTNSIIQFQNEFLSVMSCAHQFRLLEANFIISSYVSDDVFYSFRAWLISKGSEKYSKALEDPETIAEWLKTDEVENIYYSKISQLAETAFLANGENADNFFESIIYPEDPRMVIKWPESKEEFRRKYPKLVSKYWNQKLINELH
ncbi:DUF4240 domain-containing protein [Enterovibrio norvegicus]|uniref:DUF4240 domain-containing protein n=1 Tax=Enterovibrio norvegicus TaxID=188144 RepID=UPI0024B0E847|nr:DUF4240 domain-containing protein [Enterovibrio norvegicus]